MATNDAGLTAEPVITISRMYGSGGREVGKRLAKALGIAYYDREIIAQAAKESGFDEEMIESVGEKTASPLSYLFTFAPVNGVVSERTLPFSDQVFIAQSRVIRRVASEGGCVIVGRCSDYILSREESITPINVLIQSNWEERVKRVMARNDLDESAAIDRIKKIDKQRGNYYQHYTGHKWADSTQYDVTLTTSSIGIEGTVELLERYVELFDEVHRRKQQ